MMSIENYWAKVIVSARDLNFIAFQMMLFIELKSAPKLVTIGYSLLL